MTQASSDAVRIDPSRFTIIIQLEVDPARGQAFAHELIDAVSQTIVHLPGFRTAAFQLSSDRSRVINYAQWESEAVYRRSMASLDDGDDLVGDVIATHGAVVAHVESYSILATFGAAS